MFLLTVKRLQSPIDFCRAQLLNLRARINADGDQPVRRRFADILQLEQVLAHYSFRPVLLYVGFGIPVVRSSNSDHHVFRI